MVYKYTYSHYILHMIYYYIPPLYNIHYTYIYIYIYDYEYIITAKSVQ